MLTPNIDARGRRVRAVAGSGCVLAALVCLAVPRPWSPGIVVAFLSLNAAGLFMLFEASRRWCALRACGIRTPL